MMGQLTKAQRKALCRAAKRERGNICPIPGVHANAETMLLDALDRRGFIAWDGPSPATPHMRGAPRINDAGRAALSTAEGRPE
jgi:hypothetical protein